MNRLTTPLSKGGYALSDGASYEEAIQKLGKLEDLYDALKQEEARIEARMEELRTQNKQKTVTFRQLMGDKFQLSATLSRFHAYL